LLLIGVGILVVIGTVGLLWLYLHEGDAEPSLAAEELQERWSREARERRERRERGE
jgi:hypothetical protein